MSSLTLPINFVLNWVLNAGRSSLALPIHLLFILLPLPLATHLHPSPKSWMLPTNATNVQPCAYFLVTSSSPLLYSSLSASRFSISRSCHNSSVVANLLCPILSRCCRFLYCFSLVLLVPNICCCTPPLAQFKLSSKSISFIYSLVLHGISAYHLIHCSLSQAKKRTSKTISRRLKEWKRESGRVR